MAPDKPLSFVKTSALPRAAVEADLKEMTLTPHPFGSERQAALAAYWKRRAEDAGFPVHLRSFEATTPNPVLLSTPAAPADPVQKRIGRNVFAFARSAPDSSCVLLIGSHYDTKDIPGLSYVGANDGASSSALLVPLLQAARAYGAKEKLGCDIAAVWFDGEESVLPEWRDGELNHPAKQKDHTYGSRHEASALTRCGKDLCLPNELGGQRLAALVILDMVGSPGLRITPDQNSTPKLRELMQAVDDHLFAGKLVRRDTGTPIEDDHIPFAERGVPVLNIIDFENLAHWHAPGDTLANLSLESMEKAYRLALGVVLSLASSGGG